MESRGSLFSTPAKSSFTVSFNPASTHSELAGSIAFSRGKEPAQYRGPFQLHISAQGTGQCPGINTHIAPEAADPHCHLKQPFQQGQGHANRRSLILILWGVFFFLLSSNVAWTVESCVFARLSTQTHICTHTHTHVRRRAHA